MKKVFSAGVVISLMVLSTQAVLASSPSPSATASASVSASSSAKVLKIASGSAKQVLGETKVLGSTGAEKDIAKWIVVVLGGFAVLGWALRTVRSNAED